MGLTKYVKPCFNGDVGKVINLSGYLAKKEEKTTKAYLQQSALDYELALVQGMCDNCGSVGEIQTIFLSSGDRHLCEECS